jgi:hypothetical protein
VIEHYASVEAQDAMSMIKKDSKLDQIIGNRTSSGRALRRIASLVTVQQLFLQGTMRGGGRMRSVSSGYARQSAPNELPFRSVRVR